MAHPKTRILNLLRLPMKNPLLERLLVEKTVGSEFGTWFSKVPANPNQYPVGSLRKATRYGIDFELDISDLMQWYLYFGFKDPSHEALLAECGRDQVIVDVGANIGITALRMSTAVGHAGSIYAFEPDPLNRAELVRTIARNQTQNIVVFPVALSDSSRRGFLERSTHNSGMSMVKSDPARSIAEVEVVSLDSIFSERPLHRLDLIKIDVEGAEVNVIQGAQQLIKKFRPKLFVEMDDDNLKANSSSASQLLDTLSSMRYRFRRADGMPLLPSHIDHCDLVCSPEP